MNLYVDNAVADAVQDYSDHTGVPKSRIVENAVCEYMSRHAVDTNEGKRYLL